MHNKTHLYTPLGNIFHHEQTRNEDGRSWKHTQKPPCFMQSTPFPRLSLDYSKHHKSSSRRALSEQASAPSRQRRRVHQWRLALIPAAILACSLLASPSSSEALRPGGLTQLLHSFALWSCFGIMFFVSRGINRTEYVLRWTGRECAIEREQYIIFAPIQTEINLPEREMPSLTSLSHRRKTDVVSDIPHRGCYAISADRLCVHR